MPDQGFITIHEAQPQRRPVTPGPNRFPPPPPPPPTGYAAQQPARVINVAPQAAGGQQYHPHQPGPQYQARPVVTQAPQQHAVPQANTHVKISDLGRERPLTAEEAREAASEYFIFRFTRADEDSYASDGSKRKPSWKRALRVEVPGITKQEAAHTVRNLNRKTVPVAEKRESLSEAEKRQLEVTLLELQKTHDDAWFQTTLVQLDDRVKETVKEKEKGRDSRERERERERDRRKERHRKEYGLFGATRVPSKTHHKSKDTKWTITERVSLTAYFKRAPRPEVDPIIALQHRDAQRNAQLRAMQPTYAQPVARPEVAHPPPPPPQHIPPPGFAENRGPIPGHHTQAYPRGPGVAIVQPAPQRGAHAAIRQASPRRPPHRRPSPRIHGARSPPSTDVSAYSETFSVADDEDTDCTPPSTPSYVSSRGAFERAPKPQYREGPAHYGIQPKFRAGSPQGPVHIQPHRTHDRRLSPRGRRNSMSVPSHVPFPHQPTSATAPGFGLPRPAHMAGAGPMPPIPPSPPAAVQLQPGVGPGMGGPVQFPPPPGAGGHVPGHHIPPPPNHIPPPPNAPLPTMAGMPGHIPPPPPQLQPGKNPAVTQIYAEAYAAGRADTREEAIEMAERVVAAAATKPTRVESPVVIQREYPHRGRDGHHHHDRHHSRGRSSSFDRERARERRETRYRHQSLERGRDRSSSCSSSSSSSRSRSRSRLRSVGDRRNRHYRPRNDRDGRSRNVDRDRGRTRSQSLDGRRRTRGRTRTRSRSLNHRSRSRSRDRDRSRERERERLGLRDRDHARGDRATARPLSPSPPRAVSPRPWSGVRIVRPADGYTRPRVGMDREELDRDMNRLNLDEDVGYGKGVYGEQRGGGGQYRTTRSWTRDISATERDRVRREDADRMIREERERGRRARDLPLGGSNPFTPRPGLGRRAGGR